MANLHRSERKALEATNFRYTPNIDDLSDQELNERGYYHGFVCPHGHTIRDQGRHWCYHCVHKIQSNICGFDVNYLDIEYKTRYQKIWSKISIGDLGECWKIQSPGPYAPKRVCIPSYRSSYSHQKAENVSFHKALYNCAWGDVGSMFVTRTCGNQWCGNPLHMVSSWNRCVPPVNIHPFELDFKAEKLMMFLKHEKEKDVFKQDYKNVIAPAKRLGIPEE